MTSPTNPSKIKTYLGIALLLAALFYFGRLFLFHPGSSFTSGEQKPLKPSQMTFVDSNKFREPESPAHANDVAGDMNGGAPPPPAPAENKADPQLKPEDQKKVDTVEAIIKSKNDNDPRINTELKNLNAEVKRALTVKYNRMAAEDRNGRGMIVFLIARDIKSTADLEFLESVYKEPPCLSLSDCKQAPADSNPHMAGVDQTTMNYPQIAGLYQLDQQLTQNKGLLSDPNFIARIQSLLKEAENFPVPQVYQFAAKIRKKYGL